MGKRGAEKAKDMAVNGRQTREKGKCGDWENGGILPNVSLAMGTAGAPSRKEDDLILCSKE